ncbi:pectinesterase inhibitor 10-like [Chenopodium quinoa]|uniref:pectinesterase inhibitor 10-like n=1 Tax=Chenopodium quinoa TaxID=63459 RepID=UPI000B7740A5|nr:pectinesterase inhibitor 10-like [Chenopodium quinoa]
MSRQLFLVSALVFLLSISTALVADSPNVAFVKKTCNDATNVNLCLNTLLPEAGRINSHPKKATNLAIMATITEVQTASSKLTHQAKQPNLKSHEASSLNECSTIIANSVLGLNQALEESNRLNGDKQDKESKRMSMINDVRNVVNAVYHCTSYVQSSHSRDVLIKRAHDIVTPLDHLATNAVDLIHHMVF